jgi:hypothetical protein
LLHQKVNNQLKINIHKSSWIDTHFISKFPQILTIFSQTGILKVEEGWLLDTECTHIPLANLPVSKIFRKSKIFIQKQAIQTKIIQKFPHN